MFFDYVNNSDPSDNDTGWTLGTKIGSAKDRGQMQFTYFYADKEADSMLGLVTDSDFGGGGTDSKGHWLQFNYGVNKIMDHWRSVLSSTRLMSHRDARAITTA